VPEGRPIGVSIHDGGDYLSEPQTGRCDRGVYRSIGFGGPELWILGEEPPDTVNQPLTTCFLGIGSGGFDRHIGQLTKPWIL